MLAWIIEDQRETREGVAALIERHVVDARVAGAFARGHDALAALARGEPFDVALVDLGLPDIRGAEVIRQMRCDRRDAAILAFTVRFDDEALFSALRSGASGYITKDASDRDIVDAVRGAASGAACFSRDIGRRVAASFWSSAAQREPSHPDPAVVLTPREREILDLICSGASYQDVGMALGIRLGTVQSHVKNVYSKLGVGSKIEAMRLALGAAARIH
jgi:DNA-binding NarL/FixJ family response regulator